MSQVSAFGRAVRPEPARRSLFSSGSLAGWVMACLLVISAGPAHAATPPTSFADIVERIAPAVVNISTTKALPRGHNLPFPAPPPGSSCW